MWQRFAEDARRAIYHADAAAKERGVLDVSTEHLLLGLLVEGDTVVARMLWELKLDPVDLGRAIDKASRKGNRTTFDGMSLTTAGKRAIDFAYHEAVRLGDPHIGTDHTSCLASWQRVQGLPPRCRGG